MNFNEFVESPYEFQKRLTLVFIEVAYQTRNYLMTSASHPKRMIVVATGDFIDYSDECFRVFDKNGCELGTCEFRASYHEIAKTLVSLLNSR